MNERPDAAVGRIASRQRGLITADQLRGAGLGRGAIAHRLTTGRLHRVYAGVYRVGHEARPPLARELAAVLACGPHAVLSHRSAAAVWLMGPLPAREVDVSMAESRLRSRPGLRVHRLSTGAQRDTTRRDGLPLTNPARTLLDLAATAADPRAVEQALAEGLGRRIVSRTRLREALDSERGRPGTARLRQLLEAGPALTRSGAERRLLALVRRSGLPSPDTNVRVGDFELDALWREERVALEVDSYTFHSSPGSFEADRQRDAELTASGMRVVRITRDQLRFTPEAVLVRLARVLAPR